MRLLRPIVLAVIFAAGFYYFTTARRGPLQEVSWVSRPGHVDITEAAGPETVDSIEQNNILVYRRNIPAVVNITSRALTWDFFYGIVPSEGQGSGFVIDRQGHILTNFHVISEAVQSGQRGTYVYVVKADSTVESRTVVTGRTVEGLIVVESGLAAGETVVTDGQLRLSPGAKVRVKS